MPGENDKIIIEIDDDEYENDVKRKKTVRVLVFSLGGESYGVDIRDTREVIRPKQITSVPGTPAFIVGVMNLRGEIISIVDVRHFFDLKDIEKNRDMRVIITDAAGSSVGVMVDKVEDTIDIEEDAIQPPLATIKGKLAEYTKGQVNTGGEILILLDLGKILKCDEIEQLKKEG